MRLLIITQKIDETDAILGFFHSWVVELVKYCEFVTVICLEEGAHDLPENVKVLSLGKEKKHSRLQYLIRFYRYIWEERKNYDSVFVHMNQEYILLGGLLWKLLGKRITMWRNHAKGSWATNGAVFLSDKVFCTSPQSFTARFKKTEIMPVGIDTDFFKPDPLENKKKNSLLFLGRIAPVKNVDIFIEALKELKDQGIDFCATVAGDSLDKDKEYEKMIRDKVTTYGLGDTLAFTGSVNKEEALKLYREHALYVNLTPSGSMDKTIFEALASGSGVVISNIFFKEKLPEGWVVEDHKDFRKIASAIKNALSNVHGDNSNAQKDLSSLIERHSLKNTIRELIGAIATVSAPQKKR